MAMLYAVRTTQSVLQHLYTYRLLVEQTREKNCVLPDRPFCILHVSEVYILLRASLADKTSYCGVLCHVHLHQLYPEAVVVYISIYDIPLSPGESSVFGLKPALVSDTGKYYTAGANYCAGDRCWQGLYRCTYSAP